MNQQQLIRQSGSFQDYTNGAMSTPGSPLSTPGDSQWSSIRLSLTECALCRQSLNEPKLLPCIHSFCLACLQRLHACPSSPIPGFRPRSGVSQNGGFSGTTSPVYENFDSMPCPTCGQTFAIPANGLGGLQSSFFAEKLVEINKISVPAVKPCSFCMDTNNGSSGSGASNGVTGSGSPVVITRESGSPKCFHAGGSPKKELKSGGMGGGGGGGGSPSKRLSVVPSKLFCIDCQRNACADCALQHQIHCKSHTIVAVDPPMKLDEANSSKFRHNCCVEHGNEPLRWFCYDCNETLCTVCREQRHRNHRCDDVADVQEKFRGQLQEDIDKVADRLPAVQQTKEKFEAEFLRLDDTINEIASAVEQRAEDLRRLVDRQTRVLLDELGAVKQARVKELEQVVNKIGRQLALIEGFQMYTREVISRGTPCDVSRSVSDLNARATVLSSLAFNDYDQVLRSFNVAYDPAVISSSLENLGDMSVCCDNLLGRIRTTSRAKPNIVPRTSIAAAEGSNRVEQMTRVIGLDTDGRYVVGLAQLRDRMYVICGCSNTIRVYDTKQEYKRLDPIKMSKLKDPADMSACPIADCLYVTDSGNSCVWRVIKSEKGGKVEKWLPVVSWPYKSSVTTDGRVLILTWSPGKINVYSSEGKILNVVTLPNELKEPQNVIETSSGTFILTQGWTNSQVHRVVEINAAGQELRSYGIGRGCGPGQLDLPCHIAIDHIGRIIIADYNNSRLVRLDTTLWSDGGKTAGEEILATWPLPGSTVKDPRRVFFVKSPPSACSTPDNGNSGVNPAGGKILASSSKGNIAGVMSMGLAGSPLQSPSSPSRSILGSPSRGSLSGVVGGNGGRGLGFGVEGKKGLEEIECGRLLVGLGGAVDVFKVCTYLQK